MPKRKDFLRNEKILNTRGDQAFYMGAENAKIESAEKSAETGGHRKRGRFILEQPVLLATSRCLQESVW